MTITLEQANHLGDLIKACMASIKNHGKAEGSAVIAMKVPRKPRGDRMRVIGGLKGRVVQWGDSAENPSVVMVDALKLCNKLTALLTVAVEA